MQRIDENKGTMGGLKSKAEKHLDVDKMVKKQIKKD